MSLFGLLLFSYFQWRPSQEPNGIVAMNSPKEITQNYTGGIIVSGGHILATDGVKLYHYSNAGNLVRVLEKDGFRIWAYHYRDGLYWLSGSLMGKYCTIIFEGDREVADLNEVYFSYYEQVGDKLFVPFKLSPHHQAEEQFPEFNYVFLASTVTFDTTKRVIRSGQFEFCKLTDRLLDLELSFKRIWIEKFDRHYLVMNQLDPYVYIYSPTVIRIELEHGEQFPTKVPACKLSLPQYKKMPSLIWTPQKNMLTVKAAAIYRRWWLELGLITLFQRLGNNFVVSYKIPDYNADGKAVGNHLGIHVMDSNYEPVVDLLEVKGIAMGTYQNDVYILRLADGDEPTQIHTYNF